jgi:hypothetical protein
MLLFVVTLRAFGSDCAGDVVLNELFPNPAGADDDAEWVELYNKGATDVRVDGWTLLWGTSSLSSEFTFGAVTVPGDGFVVAGGNRSGAAIEIAGLAMGNASSSGDAVALEDCAGRRVDTVVYGPDNDDGFLDDMGALATSLAPAPADDASIARHADGVDTDRSGDDFVLLDSPTPGASNARDEACPGMDDVKINELLPDPDGADDGAEWIELYGLGAEPVALDGWRIEWGTSEFAAGFDLPAGTVIAPGSFLVVGGISNADLGTPLTLGNAGSSSDAVRLRHCGGRVADTVVYGEGNSDGWPDDGGDQAKSLAPAPLGGLSIARRTDGADSDQCGADFALAEPSPGAPNAVGATCTPGAFTVKLNELLPDPEGEDDGAEWIELYNAGVSSQPLDGWSIEIAKSDWADFAYAIPAGVAIAAGAFLVIGGADAEVDLAADDLTLGNAASAPDGVRIVDCEKGVQDTVLYADPTDEIDEPLLDDIGATTVAALPHESLSVGRSIDGSDTDDNASDFLEDLPPTPGEPNDVGARGGVPVGKGCAAPGAAGHCATGPRGALPATLLAWMAIRRRRRSRRPVDNSVEDG